jgi:non-heme chloroperoxidase
MGTITTKDGTEIFYKDWGKGQPLFFHHGWPLSADDWDSQMMFFLAQGYRVIAHDRRGHGRSTQTANGHDMDTYAADVAEVVKALDLQNAIHICHSTGARTVKLLKRGTLKSYPGFPHGMPTTHADVINPDLLAFIRA